MTKILRSGSAYAGRPGIEVEEDATGARLDDDGRREMVKTSLRALRRVKLRRAADLRLPPHLNDVLGRLRPEEAGRFNREMVAALSAAEQTNDLRALRDVIEAWYRTVLVTADNAFAGNMSAAVKGRPRKGESVQDLRRRYGI
ncbi:MAG: DUF6247 family protein [Candidatus Dormiibacterota bacterium]